MKFSLEIIYVKYINGKLGIIGSNIAYVKP